MRNVTSHRTERTVLACVLIATLAACDDSVTGPAIMESTDRSEPSTQTQPVSQVTLTPSAIDVQAGSLLEVALAIPSGLVQTGAKYEVVLTWDVTSG